MCRFGRLSGLKKTREVCSRVAPAAGACTCINPDGLWAEQTHRLTCRAPATCTGKRQRSWRWRRSGSPATEPSGPVTNLDPLDHLQPIPAAHWTHGGLGGVEFRPLASLFAQLLRTRTARAPSDAKASSCGFLVACGAFPSHPAKGPPGKKGGGGAKKQPTEILFCFFFFKVPLVSAVDMPPHVGTRSWLRGLPLRASSLL
jgi:hypothetical protein